MVAECPRTAERLPEGFYWVCQDMGKTANVKLWNNKQLAVSLPQKFSTSLWVPWASFPLHFGCSRPLHFGCFEGLISLHFGCPHIHIVISYINIHLINPEDREHRPGGER